jgi:hypothetical protein
MEFTNVVSKIREGIFHISMSTSPEITNKHRPLAMARSGSLTFSGNTVTFKGETHTVETPLTDERMPVHVTLTNYNGKVYEFPRSPNVDGLFAVKQKNGDFFLRGSNRNRGDKTEKEQGNYLTVKGRVYHHHRGVETSAELPAWAEAIRTRWKQGWNVLALTLRWVLWKTEDCGETEQDWEALIKNKVDHLLNSREGYVQPDALSPESTAIVDRIRRVIVDSSMAHYATRGREAKLSIPIVLRDNSKVPPAFSDLRNFAYQLGRYEKEEGVKVQMVDEGGEIDILSEWLGIELKALKRNKAPLKAFKALLKAKGEVWTDGFMGTLFGRIRAHLGMDALEAEALSTRFTAVLKQRESKSMPFDRGWPRPIRTGEDAWQLVYNLKGKTTLGELMNNKCSDIQFTQPVSSEISGSPNNKVVTKLKDGTFDVTNEYKPLTPGSVASQRELRGLSFTKGKKGMEPYKLAVLMHRNDVDLNAKVKRVVLSIKTEIEPYVIYKGQPTPSLGAASAFTSPAGRKVTFYQLNICLEGVKTNEKYDRRGTGASHLKLGWKVNGDQLTVVTETRPTGVIVPYSLPLGEVWKTEGILDAGCHSDKPGNAWSRRNNYKMAFYALNGWPVSPLVIEAQKQELVSRFIEGRLTLDWLKTTSLSLPKQIDTLLNVAKAEGFKLMTGGQRAIVTREGWHMVHQKGLVRRIKELRMAENGEAYPASNSNPSRSKEPSKPLGKNKELLTLWLRWLEYNDRLRAVERMVRGHLLGRRKAYYYALAHHLCDHTAAIQYTKLNLKDQAEKKTRKKKDKGEKAVVDNSQKYRMWASLGEFTTILKQVGIKRGVEVKEIEIALTKVAAA